MKKQEFLNDVMYEIDALKKHATKQELSKLNFDRFDFDHVNQCVYGQLTGDCSSKRAKKLMDISCIRIFDVNKHDNRYHGVDVIKGLTYSQAKNKVNGPNSGQGWFDNLGKSKEMGRRGSRNYDYLSALEGYISLKGTNNKQIIQYLKGEINDLKL